MKTIETLKTEVQAEIDAAIEGNVKSLLSGLNRTKSQNDERIETLQNANKNIDEQIVKVEKAYKDGLTEQSVGTLARELRNSGVNVPY